MFLPTGEHHVLLMRDRQQQWLAEAEYERLGLPVASTHPGLLRRIRRKLGGALIGLGRWVRGPEVMPTQRPVVSPW
jgi:hypothetical protein